MTERNEEKKKYHGYNDNPVSEKKKRIKTSNSYIYTHTHTTGQNSF